MNKWEQKCDLFLKQIKILIFVNETQIDFSYKLCSETDMMENTVS